MTASRRFGPVAGWLSGLALCIWLAWPVAGPKAQDSEVDLALILAIDCSFSVDSREFTLQMEGLGRAFMSADVKAAIAQGKHKRIAITAVQWSDDQNQMVVLPWTVIAGAADADAVGKRLRDMPRRLAQGGTSISAALRISSTLFGLAPPTERRVIDVSTDGRNNSGQPVQPVRDALVADGIVINGLTILNEWPTLDSYFEANVAGGSGNFVIPAKDYEDYGEAMLRKLLREITGPGIS